MTDADPITRSGKTNDALAKELLVRWTERAPKEPKPKPRSLGTFIGKLRRGQTEWWEKRELPTRLLAEILGCAPQEILRGLHAGAPQSIAFEDFPRLAPLRADERTPLTAWLLDPILGWATTVTPSRTWLIAPPGAGKRTAVRQLRAALGDDAVVLEVATLLEAAHSPSLRNDVTAIVHVARRDVRTDAVAFAELTGRSGATVVVAAFSPPSTADHRWSVEAPGPPAEWRRRLTEWVAARANAQGGPTVDDCLEAFAMVDPTGDCVVTPGDAMPLLAWLHGTDAAVAEPPLEKIADALVHDRLARTGCPASLVPRVAAALKAGVGVALDRQARGARPTSVEAWVEVLSTVPVAPTRAKREQAIKALAEAPARSRERRREELEALLDGDPTEVAEALIQARLLVEADLGPRPADVVAEVFGPPLPRDPGTGLDVYPRLVRRAYERAAVDQAALGGDWQRLGRWAAAPSVRPIVLDALVPRDRRELIGLAQRLLQTDERDLAWAALAEALFEVIAQQLTPELSGGLDEEGHRPARTLDEGEKAVLGALGEVQAGLVSIAARARGANEPTRLTAAPPNWSPENAAWLMRAWGYSLAVPAPRNVPTDAGWAFPGWLTEAPADAWLPNVPSRRGVADDVWRVFVHQLAVARRLVRQHPVVACGTLPNIIEAAAIIEGVAAERVGDPRRKGTDAVIAELVAVERDPAMRAQIASRVWRAFTRAPKHDPVMLLAESGVLRAFLAKELPVDTFLDGLDTDEVVQTMARRESKVDALPDRLLEALFERIAPALIAHQHEASVSLPDAIGRLTSIETLLVLLTGRFSVPRQAAARIWALKPALALAELDRALLDRPDSAACLIDASPAEYADEVLARVSVPPPALARFLTRWLAERVASGKADADPLFRALTTQPEFALPAVREATAAPRPARTRRP